MRSFCLACTQCGREKLMEPAVNYLGILTLSVGLKKSVSEKKNNEKMNRLTLRNWNVGQTVELWMTLIQPTAQLTQCSIVILSFKMQVQTSNIWEQYNNQVQNMLHKKILSMRSGK